MKTAEEALEGLLKVGGFTLAPTLPDEPAPDPVAAALDRDPEL
jgi:hypothetical protein